MITQMVKAAWPCLGLGVHTEPGGPRQQFPHLVQGQFIFLCGKLELSGCG